MPTDIEEPGGLFPMYANDIEYRRFFREITCMRSGVYYADETVVNLNEGVPEDVDADTLDEYLYDENAVSGFLDEVFNNTKDHPLFDKLYELAAAKMISQQRDIGLPVLLTYDYLDAFWKCYTLFCNSTIKSNNSNALSNKKAFEFSPIKKHCNNFNDSRNLLVQNRSRLVIFCWTWK